MEFVRRLKYIEIIIYVVRISFLYVHLIHHLVDENR